MKTFLLVLVLLALSIVVYFFILGHKSKSGEAPGLSGGQLSQCGGKPNCVCSEQADQGEFYIAPLSVTSAANALEVMKSAITEMGGEVVQETDNYLAATFTSSIFGYVDDVEARFAEEQSLLHLRSASRVGHSDLGANRKRLEQLKQAYQQQSR